MLLDGCCGWCDGHHQRPRSHRRGGGGKWNLTAAFGQADLPPDRAARRLILGRKLGQRACSCADVRALSDSAVAIATYSPSAH